MKKSTFLLMLLIITTLANGQKPADLQLKIKEMQATLSRLTLRTEHFHRNLPALKPAIPENEMLKSALATQKLDSIIYQDMNEQNTGWQNSWKDVFLYNSELKNNAWLEKEWDLTTSTWQDSAKVELEFNDAGQVNAMNIYDVDGNSGEFVLYNRSIVFYNPEGRLDSVQNYYYETPQQLNLESKQVYHYNELDQLVQMDLISFSEDEEGGMRMVYTYNDAGKIESFSLYFIDSEIEMLFSETQYLYDTTGKLIATEDYALNFFTFEVELSSRSDFEYNAAGDVSVETYFYWDSAAEEWVVEEKDEYTYNTFRNSEVIFPSYILFWGIEEGPETDNYAVKEIVTSSLMEDEWLPTYRMLYYYSEGTATSANNIKEAHVSVYPNPATDNISIRWNGHEKLLFEVYHMTGAKVFEKFVSSGMKVPVSDLGKGVYILKLTDKNQTIYSGKLVKQ